MFVDLLYGFYVASRFLTGWGFCTLYMYVFLQGGVSSPMLNPPYFAAGLGTVLGGVYVINFV
jgi:hypothetical protein